MTDMPITMAELEKNGKLCPDAQSVGLFQHEVLDFLRQNKIAWQQRELAIEMTKRLRRMGIISKDKTITEQQTRQAAMRLVKKGLVERWRKPIQKEVKDGHGEKTDRVYYGIFYTAK
jgi:hypothetical protein